MVNSTHHRSVRLPAAALAVCLVYQLGACPCGCLEHNSWLAWLGVTDHDHRRLPEHDYSRFSVPHDHDCSGEWSPQYVNTSSAPRNLWAAGQFCCPLRTAGWSELVSPQLRWEQFNRGPPGIPAMSPSLSELQVFLI